MREMLTKLEEINMRPEPFEYYTASDLWTEQHTSEQMLAYHLNTNIELSSRSGEFMDRSVQWMSSQFDLGPGTKVADHLVAFGVPEAAYV